MTDTPIPPGLTSYPALAGHRYRIAGVVRVLRSLSDEQAAQALTAAGFAALVYSPQGLPSPGPNWPTEDFPVSPIDRTFRAEGTWTKSDPIPTAIPLSNGSVILFNVWDHVPDATQVVFNPPGAVPMADLTPTSNTNRTLLLTGSALALGAAGLFAGLAIFSHRKAVAKENPIPAKRRRNPIQYAGSTTIQGIKVHIHLTDGRYCADYRAIEKYAPGHGGVTCGKTKADAEQQAQQAIRAALAPKRPPVRRPLYPSPWD